MGKPRNGVLGDQVGQALTQAFLSVSEPEEGTRTEGANKVSVNEETQDTEKDKWQS